MSHHPRLALVLLTGITLALSACASSPDLDLTIHESERGAVYVERFPDLSFQAAHPITLSADTMARVLRGVVVKKDRGLLGYLVAGKPEAVRAFRDEDVEYLAPLLAEGLTRAASDQQVGFRVVQTGAPAESTKGSLYAYGRSLYLTLPWLITMPQVRAGGPAGSPTILFIPESAIRPDSYRNARSTDATLVIDYDLRLPLNHRRLRRGNPLGEILIWTRYGRSCRTSRRSWRSKKRSGPVPLPRLPRRQRPDRLLS
jgi:hypothetical protein